MKMITSQLEFENARSRDLIKLECKICSSIFTKEKHYVQAFIKYSSTRNKGDFCSSKCFNLNQNTGITKPCSQCEKDVYRRRSASYHKRIKSDRYFCNASCSAKYNNAHKTTGTRRAKLETWIESQLKLLYPILDIKYNHILPNGCELDVYIPNLSLAFELNGIFHYEPIFGQNQLDKMKERDTRKFKHCIDNNIGLCVIDTTKQKRFTPENSKEFLDIIVNIINKEIG